MHHNIEGSEWIVAASMATGLGKVALVRQRYTTPIDVVGTGDEHHLQLSMMPYPRKIRACYVDHWGPNRFEHLGQLFLVPAGVQMRAQSECREQLSIACDFTPDRVTKWFDAVVDWTDDRLTGSLNIASTETRRWMLRIARELQNPGFASETMIELISAQICIEVARYFQRIGSSARSGGLPAWRMRLIDDYLAHDPGKASLAGLASLCGLSVRQLTRAFRASTGRSVGDYIAEHRIDRACRMLTAGQTVKETAYAVGFTASSNFAVAFRRATGATPREFQHRRRMKSGWSGER